MTKKIKLALFSFFKSTYNVLKKTPLRKIPGMLNLSNVFFRAFWPIGNIIDVQGIKMYINVNDPNRALRETFQGYGMNLIHEETTTKLFKDVVRPGNVVIDLGANIGYFTLLAAKLVGETGKVFSFEPEPSNFYYLQKNIKINDFNNAVAFQKAVSNKNGETSLFVCTYDSGHHTINQSGGIEAYRHGRSGRTKKISIETVALDDFFEGKIDRVDILKIDVEGAEAIAIEGMEKILMNNRNIKIFLEFFPLLINEMGNSPKKLINDLINKYQFSIFVIGHDYDMENSQSLLNRINNYEELATLIKNKADHVNLYLMRETKSI
ncbi:MAG: FkbM family methyltransferase [Candidatus Paceibacterota bacterium]|jgi:FkbM family methyltransferase